MYRYLWPVKTCWSMGTCGRWGPTGVQVPVAGEDILEYRYLWLVKTYWSTGTCGWWWPTGVQAPVAGKDVLEYRYLWLVRTCWSMVSAYDEPLWSRSFTFSSLILVHSLQNKYLSLTWHFLYIKEQKTFTRYFHVFAKNPYIFLRPPRKIIPILSALWWQHCYLPVGTGTGTL